MEGRKLIDLGAFKTQSPLVKGGIIGGLVVVTGLAIYGGIKATKDIKCAWQERKARKEKERAEKETKK